MGGAGVFEKKAPKGGHGRGGRGKAEPRPRGESPSLQPPSSLHFGHSHNILEKAGL